MTYLEDESDPKSPHQVKSRKKSEGIYERGEARGTRYGERDEHRHVNVRC
jgi:hypothetical protein